MGQAEVFLEDRCKDQPEEQLRVVMQAAHR